MAGLTGARFVHLAAGAVGSWVAMVSPTLPQGLDAEHCTQDAMLVLDASGSMIHQDGKGSTLLEGARSATREIVPVAAQYRRMGLMTLGPGSGDQCSNVELRVPVQNAAAKSIISAVDQLPADGGTPLSRAVEAAANAMDYRSKPAVLVIVSDGDETCGRDPCELAERLKESALDLTIHMIGFGPGNGKTAGARCLADVNGGRQVTARNAQELTTALRQTLVCPQVSDAALKGNTGKSTSR